MENCGLIIVEGMPCSGKSTSAKHIAEKLKSTAKKVCFVDEGTGKHPADYEFQSYVSKAELAEFSEDEQKNIIKNSALEAGGYIVELDKFTGNSVSENSPELFNKLLKYKIYDFLDWETESALMLEKWRKFAENADCDTVYVFNCVLLQNPMCETMMRFNFEKSESQKYISKISDIIKSLNPKVVYLQNDNIAESVRKAVNERGRDWLNSVIDYHINGGFGKSNNLKGFDGYIACLEERQKRELDILHNLGIDNIVLNISELGWEKTYEQIDKFLH